MNGYSYPCLGALIGDTIGSVYEFNNIKTTDFPLFTRKSNYTDDSIMTMAVASWLVNTDRSESALEEKLVDFASRNPYPPVGGYGCEFRKWVFTPERLQDFEGKVYGDGKRHPYNSFGNGSAMRASACGWLARSLEEALDLGKRSAEVTHNHPEGIKGAQTVAAAIFMARNAAPKEEIRAYLEQTFGYNLHRTCTEIRTSYDWDATCQGTVPPALMAFFDANDFEEAIRLAVSLGGDSDTLACITGSIAQPYFTDISDDIIRRMKSLLPEEFWIIIRKIYYCINHEHEYIHR